MSDIKTRKNIEPDFDREHWTQAKYDATAVEFVEYVKGELKLKTAANAIFDWRMKDISEEKIAEAQAKIDAIIENFFEDIQSGKVEDLLKQDKKTDAIRLHQQITGCCLAEAVKHIKSLEIS